MLMASNSKEVYILLYFKFEYRKSRTIKGDTMLKPTCATKCSILHTSILKSSAMIACSTLFYLCCQAWCGTAALEVWLCRRAKLPWLIWPLGPREVFIHLPFPHNSLVPRQVFQIDTFWLSSCSLYPPLVSKSSQAFPCDFLINPWEKKVPNSIREQIH